MDRIGSSRSIGNRAAQLGQPGLPEPRTKPMMQANIANFVRQEVRVSKRKPLLPIFEAVSNSLDAITDRRRRGTIRVTVLRVPELLDSSRGQPHTFIVEDNGIGFNHENMAAFDELYSERKIRHGGKGRGRFAFLKVFEKVEISSTFETTQGKKTRTLTFDTNYAVYMGDPRDRTDDVGTR